MINRDNSRKKVDAFRGMRVRMGVHTGVADTVHTHENTHRLVYGGKVRSAMTGSKLVADEVPTDGLALLTVLRVG